MGRGSPLCAKLHERIVCQFKDNVSHSKIAKNFGLSPSTVHNIVKRFRESGEISVRKGKCAGTAAAEWPSSPQAILFEKPSCYHDGHSHMGSGVLWKIIVTQQSVAASRNATWNCIIAKRKAFICVETPPSSLRWTERQWKHVLWSDESTFQLVFGKNGRRILRAKDENDHPDCYQWKVQKPASVMVWGCISAHGMGDLHICEGTIDAEAYVGILETYAAERLLFPGTPCLFQQDNGRPHSARATVTGWLHRHRVHVLDWPACSPDLSPIENVWRIMKRRIRQW